MTYREGMERNKASVRTNMLLNAQEKVEAGITIENIILALYILGLSSSVALFFSYMPLTYFFMVTIFISLISGIKYSGLISNKTIIVLMRGSFIWLAILLALSIAKTVRPYIVL